MRVRLRPQGTDVACPLMLVVRPRCRAALVVGTERGGAPGVAAHVRKKLRAVGGSGMGIDNDKPHRSLATIIA